MYYPSCETGILFHFTALSFLPFERIIGMNHDLVREDETLEDLNPYGFRIIQKKEGFRFGMDSVLLAEFAGIRTDDHVADFGSGSCVLPLLLIGRKKGKTFECFEIQKEIAEMARRTITLNGLDNRIRFFSEAVQNAGDLLDACSLDAIICNPPYALPGAGIKSPFLTRSIARNQEDDTLSGFFRIAFRLLKGKGKFSMVYPAAQMFQVMTLLKASHLEPKRFQLVYPYEDKPANLVLVEAVKDAKPGLHPQPPLIIYTPDHLLTNRLKSVYHMSRETNDE